MEQQRDAASSRNSRDNVDGHEDSLHFEEDDDQNERDRDREAPRRVRGRGRGFQKRDGKRLEPLPVWEVPRDNKYYLHDDRVAAAAAAAAARKAEK